MSDIVLKLRNAAQLINEVRTSLIRHLKHRRQRLTLPLSGQY